LCDGDKDIVPGSQFSVNVSSVWEWLLVPGVWAKSYELLVFDSRLLAPTRPQTRSARECLQVNISQLAFPGGYIEYKQESM